MASYSMRRQRDAFIETLSNDKILNAYPEGEKIKLDQIAAGRKALKQYWNYFPIRAIVNIALPFIMLFANFYLLIKYLLLTAFHKRVPLTSKRLFVGHDRRLYTLSQNNKICKDDDPWLRFLTDTYSLPKDKMQLQVLDFVSPVDVIKSFFQAWLIHIRTIITVGYNMYFLSYKAFEWSLTDYALRNIPNDVELFHSYICDRNAILIDKLPHQKKTLIQHGTMHFGNKTVDIPYYKFMEEEGFYIWTGLYKSSPTTVYCFTKTDEWALTNSVIANKPSFIYMGYGFKPSYKPTKKSILIVSNYYIFAEREEQILSRLQDLDITLYIKNHPSHSDDLYEEMQSKYRFNFIKGLETKLPEVDLLISYDSTLAYEYASIGTKVLYYGHFEINEIREIVSKYLDLELSSN